MIRQTVMKIKRDLMDYIQNKIHSTRKYFKSEIFFNGSEGVILPPALFFRHGSVNGAVPR
jgi:hypothetical protein